MTRQPLDGLSVLELSTMIAGPYAGQMLGDLGADVVKLERPGRGELARGLEPTVNGESFYYLTANRNKRSLPLDVSTAEGRELFLDLAERADVVLENFPPTFTERFDVGYDAVRERNERIVYCSISAYGETGPYRSYPGIDTTVQALSGAMSTTREADGPPMRSGVPFNDVFAALYAVQGVLTALLHRETTGEGEHVDVSLLDSGLAGLTTRAVYSFVTGEPYPPFGRRHNYFAPEGRYEAADGYVNLSVVTDRHWRAFCEALDAADLAAETRYETVAGRVEHRDELDDRLDDLLSGRPVEELLERLLAANVPVAAVEDTTSVWDHPQVRAREMRRTLDHPTAGTVETLGFPVKFDDIEPRIDAHPPLLGEHTVEVLSELGLSADEIDALVEAGVTERYGD